MSVLLRSAFSSPFAACRLQRMNTLAAFANSSIGRKWIVAVTGLSLVGFVIVHMLGNLQILWPGGGGREHLNSYAEHLHDLGPLLWLARIGLLVCFVAHVYYTYKLALENRAARPQRYAHPRRIVASDPRADDAAQRTACCWRSLSSTSHTSPGRSFRSSPSTRDLLSTPPDDPTFTTWS